MKALRQESLNSALPASRWLYFKNTAALNDDIREALEHGTQAEDEAQDLRKARQAMLSKFKDFSDKVIDEAEKSEHVEAATDPAKNLAKAVSAQVKNLLEPASKAKRNSLGLSDKYDDLVSDIIDQTDKAEATLSDVSFAFNSLAQAKTKLEAQLMDKEARKEERVLVNRWFSSEKKDITDNPGKRKSEQAIFASRRTVIQQVLTDLESELGQRQTKVKEWTQAHAKRVEAEFNDLIPEKQAQFMELSQEELSTGKKKLSADLVTTVMEDLPLAQRLEVYRLMNFDQRTLSTNLETLSAAGNGIRTQALKLREAHANHVGNLKFAKLKANLNLGDEKVEPADGLNSLVPALKDFLTASGTKNRDDLFKDFAGHKHLNLTQEFVVYSEFLSDSKSAKSELATMPLELRKQIAAYLLHLEGASAIEADKDQWSAEFLKLEKNEVAPLIESSEAVFNEPKVSGKTAIKDVQNLSQITSDTFNALSTFVTTATTKVHEVREAAKSLNEKERTTIEASLNQVEAVITMVKDLETQWSAEASAFNEKEKHYDYWNRKSNDLKASAPIKSPSDVAAEIKAKAGTRTVKGVSEDIIETTNRDIIELQKQSLANYTKAMAAIQEKLDEHQNEKPDKAKTLCTARVDTHQLTTLTLQVDSFKKTLSKRHSGTATSKDAAMKAYLETQSNRADNQLIEEALDANQQTAFAVIQKMRAGSTVKMRYHQYKHGTAPTTEDMLRNISSSQTFKILMQAGSGTVLYKPSEKELTIVQQSSTDGKIQIIKVPAPSGNLAKDGLPTNFVLSSETQLVGTPHNITAA